jgi:hypothetical protein
MTDTFVFIIAASVLGTVVAVYWFGFDAIAWAAATLLRASGLQ